QFALSGSPAPPEAVRLRFRGALPLRVGGRPCTITRADPVFPSPGHSLFLHPGPPRVNAAWMPRNKNESLADVHREFPLRSRSGARDLGDLPGLLLPRREAPPLVAARR